MGLEVGRGYRAESRGAFQHGIEREVGYAISVAALPARPEKNEDRPDIGLEKPRYMGSPTPAVGGREGADLP
jgi:hypothetical protein